MHSVLHPGSMHVHTPQHTMTLVCVQRPLANHCTAALEPQFTVKSHTPHHTMTLLS